MHLDVSWLLSVLLGSMRMTVMLMFTPVLGGVHVPAQARVVLLLALTAIMLSVAHPPAPSMANMDVGRLALLTLTELVIGAAMAFGLQCAFGAMALAGRMIDLQIGFSVGAIFDPVTRAPSPMLGTLLTMLGTFLFYTMDGHHLLIRMVAHSFSSLPVGSTMPWQTVEPFVEQFGLMFVFGLTLAAPVVVALFLVDLSLGLVSRTMPQMNVFLIGFIVKIIVGLLVFMVSLSSMLDVMRRIMSSTSQYWQSLLP
jgi:flagellar biosynthetic protein FliR